MENIREETRTEPRARSLSERLAWLEEKQSIGKMQEDTKKNAKPVKFPFKWRRQLNKSTGKLSTDQVLVWYLNIKGEMESPQVMPLYSGNIIIHKNKAYEFDPRSLWTIRLKNKIYKCLIIREIDRRPVANLDWDEVKKRGDATDSDEILVKMVTKALIEKQKKAVGKGVVVLIVVGIVALAVFFLFFKK